MFSFQLLMLLIFSRRLSPSKARRIQPSEAAVESSDIINTNRDANRALLNVRSKLAANLSVESRVNELIQEATSSQNLAGMFYGIVLYAHVISAYDLRNPTFKLIL
jgi:phosphatidylinositol kinase/protein kinase (PI-3  family)